MREELSLSSSSQLVVVAGCVILNSVVILFYLLEYSIGREILNGMVHVESWREEETTLQFYKHFLLI